MVQQCLSHPIQQAKVCCICVSWSAHAAACGLPEEVLH